MATAGLEALTGVILKACGDLITSTQKADGIIALSVRQSHSEQFKASVRSYVKAHNKQYGTHVAVSFPARFSIRLQEAKRSARAKR